MLREWGSSADNRQPRQLRGRKYYWSTRPAKQQPRRSEKRQHHSDEVVTSARVFPFQQRFDTTVCFDGLTLPELGGLLAALQPALLLIRKSSRGRASGTTGLAWLRRGAGAGEAVVRRRARG